MRFSIVAAAAVIAAGLGFFPSGLEAQPTLPLPAPGAPPATTPDAPALPGAPGEDARARAAAMAAKANIDITDAWTIPP